MNCAPSVYVFSGVLQDYKLGLRMLLKYPGLTFAGGLALAIAIGVGAGWYDLSGQILAPTIPLPEGDRLVLIETQNTLTNAPEPRVVRDFLEWRRELRTIEDLGAYRADTRNLIIGDAAPMWLPDLVAIGALEPIDDYVAKYLNPSDLEDYLADVKNLGLWNGKRYGLFDDGDHLLWYYRKDLFSDPQNQADFKTKFGRDLGTPKTYMFQDMLDAAQFFSEKGNGQYFGVGLLSGGTDFNWSGNTI